MIDKQKFFELCEEANNHYCKYLEKAKSEVVRWEYTDKKKYDLTPFWFERNLEPRGLLMDSNENERLRYGFNIDGNLCYSKDWLETCYEYSEDMVIGRRYYNGNIDSIEILTLINGVPKSYVEFIVRNGLEPGQEWHFEEKYIYEEGKLKGIELNQYLHAGLSHSFYKYFLNYQDNGDLFSIINNKGRVIYQYMGAEEALQLRQKIKDDLLAQSTEIFKKISKLVGDNRVCFIGIWLHSDPDVVINPPFHPGLQRIRDEQILHQEGRWIIWNAGQHPLKNQVGIENEELLEQLRLLIQYWQIHKDWWIETKELWKEVVVKLNLLKWDHVFPITEDFVIFIDADDIELTDEYLEECIPEEKILLLRNKGLL
jgi:hypothetical protein